MHLYILLTIASIVGVSAVVAENNYGVLRALVLMRPKNFLHYTDTKLHRPTSVKQVKINPQYPLVSPYEYDEGHSEPYYFCPKKENKKVLFGKTLLGKFDSPFQCSTPLRTRFVHSDSLNFHNRKGELYSHEYEYCYQKDENTEICGTDSVYKFLYELSEMRILYVQYTIYSRNLLDSVEIYDEEKNFIMEPTSLVEENGCEALKIGLKYMEHKMEIFALEGEKDNPHQYYRATLASRFHFPLVQYKRPLFHYSNITLVHEDILNLFVETQKFISKIEMDELRIFAVPYFYNSENDTQNRGTQETGIQNEDVIMEDVQKEGNEKSRREYPPDVIAYLIFNNEGKDGIAIILHNKSKSDEEKIKEQCDNDHKMKCERYYKYLNEKQVNKEILTSAYCCKVNHILEKWIFPTPVELSGKQFGDLDI